MKAVLVFGLEDEVWRLSTNSRGGEMITLSQGSFGSEGDDIEDLMGLVFLLFSNIFTRFETPAGKSLLHSPGEGCKVKGFGILLK